MKLITQWIGPIDKRKEFPLGINGFVPVLHKLYQYILRRILSMDVNVMKRPAIKLN